MIARLVLLALLPVTAGLALLQRRRLYAIIGMALFSLLLASVFFLSHAPDVAITEAAVGAALVTFIYVLAIRRTGKLTVVANEVPGLFERSGNQLQGLEWEILDRLARRLGLDLAVRFVPLEEVEGSLLQGNADVGAGGLILDGCHRRLLRTPDYLPTARFSIMGPAAAETGDESEGAEGMPLRGYLSDIVDDVQAGRSVTIRLDLARFHALSRYGLEGYRVVRHDGEWGYAMAVAPERRDLHRQLGALLKQLRETGELQQMTRENLP